MQDSVLFNKEFSKRKSQGQALVEFAMSLFILLLLISGIVDLGRAIFTYMDLREAAQEGAAYASVYPMDDNGDLNKPAIEDRVKQSSNVFVGYTPVIDVSLIGPACAGITDGISNSIIVEAEIKKFPLTMPFLGAIVGSQEIGISATVTEKILTPTCS